jgi:hypothetical protein
LWLLPLVAFLRRSQALDLGLRLFDALLALAGGTFVSGMLPLGGLLVGFFAFEFFDVSACRR